MAVTRHLGNGEVRAFPIQYTPTMDSEVTVGGEAVAVLTHTPASVTLSEAPPVNAEVLITHTAEGFPVTYEELGFDSVLWDVALSSESARAAIKRSAAPYLPLATALPAQVQLRKLRSDFPEFAVYAPISADGRAWARWFFTNRFNTGNSGAPRMNRATLSWLYAGSTIAPHPVNVSNAAEGQAPSVTQGTAAATARVGTWTASATVGGMTDIRWSDVTGDYVEYTITGVTRISHRHYGTSNGAFVSVLITDAGTEIPASQYVTRTTKIIFHGPTAGQYHTPLAVGLDPAKTYVVRLTRDASSTATHRHYDGGLVGYANLAFDAVGFWGPFFTQSLGNPAVNTSATWATGSVAVYQIDNATRISWRYMRNAAAGEAAFTVFDATGAEIAAGAYAATTVDMYEASNAQPVPVMVADGLPRGTYYLHVRLLNTKNSLATDFRMYDFGAFGFDTGAAGVLGTDAFDDGAISNASMTSGDRTMIGTGNLEQAIKVRKVGETANTSADQFVGGTHGFESAPSSLVYRIDGAPIDFAGGAVGATWTGASFDLSFATTLRFPSDASSFATSTQTLAVSRTGYEATVTRTTLAESIISEDYSLMLNVPDTTATDGLDGGCDDWVIGPAREAIAANNQNNAALDAATRAVYFEVGNAAYAAFGAQLNWPELDAAHADPLFAGTRAWSFVQDRSDIYGKAYNRSFRASVNTGVTVPSGHAATARKAYFVGLKA
jgi:hypothetical protein